MSGCRRGGHHPGDTVDIALHLRNPAGPPDRWQVGFREELASEFTLAEGYGGELDPAERCTWESLPDNDPSPTGRATHARGVCAPVVAVGPLGVVR